MDRFAEFVARLTGNPSARPADLAAHLHLSRAQFDRVVGALGGETPGRLRRRVLLERAAYRLRTTRVPIIDAAMEAGYTSHEAFTRAFQRVYYRSPQQWRSASASFHLPTPNGVHFYPPAGLRLPARKGTTRMIASLVDHHIAVLQQLLDRADQLGDDLLDAPLHPPGPGIDTDPTVRSLLARLAGQLDMWLAAMASVPYDLASEEHQTIAAIRARLARVGPEFSAYVHGLDQRESFDETFVDATGDPPYLFTAAGMVAHIVTYAAYRRTMVVSALAAAGQDVDDDPLTWFRPSTGDAPA